MTSFTLDFSTIYNYADDNTLSYADYDLNNVISKLESDTQTMLAPRSLACSSHFILLPFKSKQICSLKVFLSIAKAWNSSGLACKNSRKGTQVYL
jgi:hypothetical protein